MKIVRTFKAGLLTASALVLLHPTAFAQEGASDESEEVTQTTSDVIVVTAQRRARQDSLRQRRESLNLTEVLTSDDIGKLPDLNLAESLSRLPGVSVQRSGGEGRFVSIRGLEPGLNLVTVNGQPTAVSDVDGRAGRAAPLDVIGAGDYGQVEVVKVKRPDQDAQGIGGAINVVSPSAFSRDEPFGYATVGAGLNDLGDNGEFNASAGAGTTFRNDMIGIFVGGSYSQRDFETQTVSTRWDRVDDVLGVLPEDSGFFPDRLELTQSITDRTRYALQTNFELRPGVGTSLFARANYNRFEDDELRPQVEVDFRDDPVPNSVTSGALPETRTQMETRDEKTERQILNLSTGGEHQFGYDDEFTIAAELTYSYASEDTPRLNYFEAQQVNRPTGAVDISDFLPQVQINGEGRFDPSSFVIEKIRFETSNQDETLYVPAADFAWDRSIFGFDQTFTMGVKATLRSRGVADVSNRFRPSSPVSLTDLTVDGPTNFSSGGYNFGPVPDPLSFTEFYQENQSEFDFLAVQSIANTFEDSYEIDENIYAAYVQSQITSGNLDILLGVRVEQTDNSISAQQVTVIEDTEFSSRDASEIIEFGDKQLVVDPRSFDRDYTNIFPNAQARYNIAENVILRAAYSTAIGRPDFVALAPIEELEVEPLISPAIPVFTGSLDQGNPYLEPFEAQNFDFGVEWYFDEGSILGVSLFHKEIDNPIFNFLEVQQDGALIDRLLSGDFSNLSSTINRDEFALAVLQRTTVLNAKQGEVSGVEFLYQQQFDFLPGLLRGFGASVNATFSTSEATVEPQEIEGEVFGRLPGADTSVPLFEQPDTTINAQIFYEMDRVQARLAWQYTSERLAVLGPSPEGDLYRDESQRFDLSVRVALSDRAGLVFEGTNLTDESDTGFQGEPSRLASTTEYGRTFRLSAALTF